nr:hypothetical protein [Escherichia coli]
MVSLPRPDNYRGNDNRCNRKPDKINKTIMNITIISPVISIPYCPACFSWSQSALFLSASERHCPGFSGYSSGLREVSEIQSVELDFLRSSAVIPQSGMLRTAKTDAR